MTRARFRIGPNGFLQGRLSRGVGIRVPETSGTCSRLLKWRDLPGKVAVPGCFTLRGEASGMRRQFVTVRAGRQVFSYSIWSRVCERPIE